MSVAAPAAPDKVNFLVCGRARAGSEQAFADWQRRLADAALTAAGCQSSEAWPPAPPDQEEWVGVLRFSSLGALRSWRALESTKQLLAQAAPLVEGGKLTQLTGGAATEFYAQQSVTEVIVTDVKPGKEELFRVWSDRIQKVQNGFPGFRGTYMQPPHDGETGWTTLVRFDTAEQLNAWLEAPQRTALLREAEGLVDRVVLHRVDSSFPGWAPNDPTTGKPPAAWKTATLVLLTLFPIVMLELRFLTPHLRELNPALSMFIGNVISVGLVTWPLMPLAVWVFRKWIFADGETAWNIAGPALVVLGYVIELALLWHLVG